MISFLAKCLEPIRSCRCRTKFHSALQKPVYYGQFHLSRQKCSQQVNADNRHFFVTQVTYSHKSKLYRQWLHLSMLSHCRCDFSSLIKMLILAFNTIETSTISEAFPFPWKIISNQLLYLSLRVLMAKLDYMHNTR